MQLLNFNSIKVRLKPVSRVKKRLIARFQFHKGTIKTRYEERKFQGRQNFNSIKVRLKPKTLSGKLLSK